MTLDLGETIRKLQSYQNTQYPILSVYLPIEPINQQNNQLVQQFNELINGSLTKQDRKTLKRDILYIKSYLKILDNTHNYQGIALFSGGNTLWEVITVPFKLQMALAVGHAPFLEPLRKQLTQYQRYLVVLADRENARYFTLFSGELENQGEFHEVVPQKVKGGKLGMRSSKVDRHIKDHLHKHFDHVAKTIKEFVGNKSINGVLVGGHSEIINSMTRHLPKRLKDKIVAEFVAEPLSSMNDLLKKSKDIIQTVQKRMIHRKDVYFYA